MVNIGYQRKNKLFEIASQQAGYFTAKQAVQCGYSYRLQSYHKNQGTWLEVERGIFRLANYPDSPNEDLVRWSLWSFNRDGFSQAVGLRESNNFLRITTGFLCGLGILSYSFS